MYEVGADTEPTENTAEAIEYPRESIPPKSFSVPAETFQRGSPMTTSAVERNKAPTLAPPLNFKQPYSFAPRIPSGDQPAKRHSSPAKDLSNESVGYDSVLDDNFSPIRLSPLKAALRKSPAPNSPIPMKAFPGNYELPAPRYEQDSLGHEVSAPSSSLLSSSPPTTPQRVQAGIADASSSPFDEEVPTGSPVKVSNTAPSRSPKRRLSYIEVPQAGEDGPSTPPERRLKENIEVAPDTITRRRFGRRASLELVSMANEPLMERLKATARGYLVRKRLGPISAGLPSQDPGPSAGPSAAPFGILSSFIKKHGQKAKHIPVPSRARSMVPLPTNTMSCQ